VSHRLSLRSGSRQNHATAAADRASDAELSDVLSEFARTMVTDFPIQDILDHLVQRIVEIMPVTGAGVTLISAGRGPRYIAASNAAAMRFEELQSELSEGPCLAAYHTGEAVSVADLSTDTRFASFSPKALEAGLAAVFTFPLRHGPARLGALDLYRDIPGELTRRSMNRAQTLADVAAAYLLNAEARADLQDSADRSREASLHDALTGLPNRALMFERLEHGSLRGRRSHKTMALFFVDLDHFKEVNDTHGHQIGDELLVAVAERLTGILRPGDTLARMSGDEFLILCEDLEDEADAETILARIDDVLAPPFELSGVELAVTASIGSALTASGERAAKQLIHHADLAMYKMKRRAAGTRNVLDAGRDDVPGEPNDLGEALAGAAERGELHLDYQPIVDAVDGRLNGVEALLRWRHPSRGLVPPSLVIPVAEQCGEIGEIGRWALRQAWSDQHSWQGERAGDLAVSVNISAQQLLAAGFADMVATVLLSGSSDPRLLTLEMTESVLVKDSERTAVVLNALKGIGVTLALDDFGTGSASLRQIMDYPIDTIKVDRAFVANLTPATASETIVTSVVQFAHGLGKTVVSEGVETVQQHQALTRLGTDACQGFYFARPMPASGIDALIRYAGPQSDTHLPARF
jgi:diguanylate cyclase (GGDEF)-like protein